jgi:hypothetical protein
MRARLLRNPADLEAWLLMSRLVEGQAQQDCLQRASLLMQSAQVASMLPPTGNAAPREQPVQTSHEHPAPVPAGPTPRRIGEYLIARGALTTAQLDQALRDQRRRRSAGVLMPIGDILVQRGFVTPRTLAEALVDMHKERIATPNALPFLLGEYLLAAGLITPQQLAASLEAQIVDAQMGRYTLLGTILIRRGIITQAALDTFLSQQRAARVTHPVGRA